MSTENQITANRENAKLSTGPKTPEGKANSRLNAMSHGLTAKHLVVLPQDEAEFESLRRILTDQLNPHHGIEMITFNNLLHAAWNIHRIHLAEAEIFYTQLNGATDPLVSAECDARLDRLARYAARANRDYYRALQELRTLQTNRILRHTSDIEEPGLVIPVLADIKSMNKRKHQDLARDIVKQALRSPDGVPPYHGYNPRR